MVYFKSAEPFGKHSLVPFTAPISIGKIYYDGGHGIWKSVVQ